MCTHLLPLLLLMIMNMKPLQVFIHGGIDVLITQSFTGLCCLFILHLVCSCPRYCHLNWKSFTGCTTSAKQLHLTTQRPLILLWWIALQFWCLSSISVQSFLMAQSSFRTEKVDYMHYSRSNIVALLQNPPSTPLATTHTCIHIHIHTNTHSSLSLCSDEICT